MSAPTLRPYQVRAVDAIFRAWESGVLRPAISAATGAGKSVIFGAVARRHLASRRADGPVVLLAHRRELITQAAAHFKRANPSMNVEIVIGSPGRYGSTKRLQALYRWRAADVLVTTPQTLRSASTMRDFPNPSLIITDEAHHYASVMFRNVLTALGAFSGTRVLGVTATPFREDYRTLIDADDKTAVFERIVAAIDIGWLITHRDCPETKQETECRPGLGYLVPPRLRHITVDGLDLRDVPTSRMSGAVDYREHELAEAMQEAGAFDVVAKTIAGELSGRKGVIFAPTVASSKYLVEIMGDLGLTCAHIDGEMATPERDRVIEDFRAGRVDWLSNVGIVSEGFDLPEIDTVVLARPTRSRIFFRQAVGRALRPAPGKDHAVVLDVAGASDGHSLAGVEALTDSDVLEAVDGEDLLELLSRSDRARQGLVDRITAHRDDLMERQNTGERSYEQVKITCENFGDRLPGLAAFIDRATPMVHRLLDTTTTGIDLAASVFGADRTMDELSDVEKRVAGHIVTATGQLSHIEQVKAALRQALIALREDPESDVAKAVITGYVGTVAGTLFGEEDEHAEAKAPGTVQGLKVRGGPKAAKPVFEQRQGWAIRTAKGALYCPIHSGRDVVALAVAVPKRTVTGATHWVPLIWTRSRGEVDYIGRYGALTEEQAYRIIADFAAENTASPSFLNPNAAWRKKPPSDGARALARRIAPAVHIPDEATAGFVADVIEYGKNTGIADGLIGWLTQNA